MRQASCVHSRGQSRKPLNSRQKDRTVRNRSQAPSDGHPGPIVGPRKVRWGRTLVLSLGWAACAALPLLIFLGLSRAGVEFHGVFTVIALPTLAYAVPAIPFAMVADHLPAPLRLPVAGLWCALAWTGWIHLGRSGRLGIVPLVVVPVLVALGAAVVTPGYLGAQEKARNAACDQAYAAPWEILTAELVASRRSGSASPICGARTSEALVSCFLARQQDASNPLNRRSSMYAASAPEPCQVELVPRGPNRIEIRQQPVPGARTRTYSIAVE